jgi:hypothetical protein
MSSGWWFCPICETANEAPALTCVVCEGRPSGSLPENGGLKGDLVRRAAPRVPTSAAEPFPRPTPRTRATRSSVRVTWQQRLRAGARRVYDECAELIRWIADALS